MIQAGVKDRIIAAPSLQDLYSSNQGQSKVVMLLESLEIFCLACDSEIVDENASRMFGSSEKKIIEIRQEFIKHLEQYYEKTLSILF